MSGKVGSKRNRLGEILMSHANELGMILRNRYFQLRTKSYDSQEDLGSRSPSACILIE